MRILGTALVIWITCFSAGCADEPIGQPCTFSWPVDDDGSKCEEFPSCAPLQNTNQNIGETPLNDTCPVDCIQIPSLECTNLICVATQVEDGPAGESKEQLMNGECSAEVARTECTGSGEASFGCMGYCTKECLSGASCPKGYRCTQMAPFGENLRCDDEGQWGDGDPGPAASDPTKKCTDDCIMEGVTNDDGVVCPSSVEGDDLYDYELCDQKEYATCCACLCYRFCPLLTKKFCRKIEWDQELFPGGKTENPNCAAAE